MKDFSVYSTRDLMRAARAITPQDDAERWILTAEERVWRQDGPGWMAVDSDGRQQETNGYREWYADGDVREFVIEQLEHYGVTPDSWHMEAH